MRSEDNLKRGKPREGRRFSDPLLQQFIECMRAKGAELTLGEADLQLGTLVEFFEMLIEGDRRLKDREKAQGLPDSSN